MNADFKDLLKALNQQNAEYLVVGGWAVIEYTEPRYTKDLDVWVNPTRENAARVFQALRDFGAPLTSVNVEDFYDRTTIYQVGVAPIRVDVLKAIDGLEFEQAWANRVSIDCDGIMAWFISMEDLLIAKRTAGRPQDRIDAKNLRFAIKQKNKKTK